MGELCRIIRHLGSGIAMNEFGATAAQRGATRSSLFEIACVLVRLDHVAIAVWRPKRRYQLNYVSIYDGKPRCY
jgi:hypothetical protein